MKRLLLFCFLSLMPSLLFASKHAPLADEASQAKSIYIVNQTGNQDVVDGAYEAFSQWGHFSLAKTKDEADLVAVFSSVTKLHEGTSSVRTEMSVFVPKKEDAVFQTTQRRDAFRGQASSAKNCVSEFKKRFNGK